MRVFYKVLTPILGLIFFFFTSVFILKFDTLAKEKSLFRLGYIVSAILVLALILYLFFKSYKAWFKHKKRL